MFDHRQRTWTRQTWGWRLHVCLGCGPSAPRRDRRPSGRRGGTRLRHTGSVVDDFLIARNRSPDSRLPYLVRIPLGDRGIVPKTKDVWPRTSKLCCHRADD